MEKSRGLICTTKVEKFTTQDIKDWKDLKDWKEMREMKDLKD